MCQHDAVKPGELSAALELTANGSGMSDMHAATHVSMRRMDRCAQSARKRSFSSTLDSVTASLDRFLRHTDGGNGEQETDDGRKPHVHHPRQNL